MSCGFNMIQLVSHCASLCIESCISETSGIDNADQYIIQHKIYQFYLQPIGRKLRGRKEQFLASSCDDAPRSTHSREGMERERKKKKRKETKRKEKTGKKRKERMAVPAMPSIQGPATGKVEGRYSQLCYASKDVPGREEEEKKVYPATRLRPRSHPGRGGERDVGMAIKLLPRI
jgi:hypothetical protein